MSEWSSRSSGASTATAEPVDRRWFEEALRAQGFLVEPPAVEDDPLWVESALSDQSLADEVLDDLPLGVESDDLMYAAHETPPVTEDVAVQPDVPAEVESTSGVELLTAVPEMPDETVRAAETPDLGPVAIAATPGSATWPVIGATPARLGPAAVVSPDADVTAPAARRAVAPSTLAVAGSPVPTAALAARLSRGVGTAPAARTIPASPATPAAPVIAASPVATIKAVAPIESLAATRATSISGDPWTLPALQADLAAEREGASAAVVDTDSRPVAATAVTATVVTGTAVTEPMVAEPPPVVEAVAAPTSVPFPVETVPSVDSQPPGPAATMGIGVPAPPATVTAAPAEPVTPFTPPTTPATGIAAIAPRPTSTTVATTVDGGESDLWGLVGDPAKSAAATEVAPAAKASSTTTALLTIFVAIVVVVLVLGFIYLFTSLL